MQQYEFENTSQEKVSINQLFKKHDYLVVLHNMGKSCPHCAIWGDEFNAMLPHISKVADFCVIGPDDSDTQKDYAEKRGWDAAIVSAKNNSFIQDMGFQNEQGFMPGVSIFEKQGEAIECIKQINVVRDGHIPSVLQVLTLIPNADTRNIAWN